MPYPTAPASFPRMDLAGPASAIDPAAMGFAALRVLPALEAPEQRVRWFKYTLATWLKAANTERTYNGGTQNLDLDLEEATANLVEHALKTSVDVTQNDAWNGNGYDEAGRIRLVSTIIMRRFETLAAAVLENETTFADNLKTVSTVWSNTSSTPIDDVNDARSKVVIATGISPNFLRLTEEQVKVLATNPQVTARYKGASTDIIPTFMGKDREKALAEVFDIEEVVICNARYNSANQGQTLSAAGVWDRTKAMVGFKLATPGSHKEVQLGRHLLLTTEDLSGIGSESRGEAQVAELNLYVDQYATPDTKSDNLRATRTGVAKIWEPKCASLLKTVIA